MGGTYFLMNKDRRVLTLQSEATFGFTAFRIIERHGGCLPYGFTSPDEWIERRQVAKHRAQLRRLMRAWGLDDRPGFIDFTHCASLMDAFWMKRADSPLTWKDVSLYRNPFNDTVADLAYDGAGDCGRRLDLPTPELATPGSFEKCWRRTDAGIFQYKRGRKGALSVAAAPHSEKLTCDLLRAMGINHVPYALTVYRDAIASYCPIFTTEDEGFITFAAYAGKRVGEPQEIMDIIGRVADEDRFREMVVADAISLNVDRHQGNYGFTVDNATGEITGFAPLFDHNLSQLPGLAPSDDVDDYLA
ncbi:MAG: hypothetical protein IKE76_13250, partial [Clostridia bacterium]|nr:hypothetical protein [Clostridia bacterium]